jgi:hypothetical protein
MTTSRKSKKRASNKTRRVATFDMKLTRSELIHLRDLFGVLLPPSGDMTLSKALAMQTTGSSLIEGRLWRKIEAACTSAGVPTEDGAPDFAVTVTGPIKIDVVPVELASDDDDAGVINDTVFVGDG